MEAREHETVRTDAFPWQPLLVATIAGYLAISVAMLTVGEVLVNVAFTRGVRTWDLDVSRWFVDHRNETWDLLTEIASRSADTLGVVGLALVVQAVLVIRGRHRELVLLVVGLGLELSVFLTVNYLVDRPRPDVVKLGSQPSTASFPSGHTAATFVVWAGIVVLIRRDRKTSDEVRRTLGTVAAVIGAVMIVSVAGARVYRGMHHVTDVAAGAVMGAACISVAIAIVGVVDGRRAVNGTPTPEPHSLEVAR